MTEQKPTRKDVLLAMAPTEAGVVYAAAVPTERPEVGWFELRDPTSWVDSR